MNTPHQDFQKAKEELIDLLKHHEAVLAFQEAEESIGQIPQISDLAGQMKAYQQEAVLFQKIEKQRAYEEAGEQADLIQHELENLPIVQDYRQKMQIIPFLWQVCLIIQLKHTLMFWLRWATR